MAPVILYAFKVLFSSVSSSSIVVHSAQLAGIGCEKSISAFSNVSTVLNISVFVSSVYKAL